MDEKWCILYLFFNNIFLDKNLLIDEVIDDVAISMLVLTWFLSMEWIQ